MSTSKSTAGADKAPRSTWDSTRAPWMAGVCTTDAACHVYPNAKRHAHKSPLCRLGFAFCFACYIPVAEPSGKGMNSGCDKFFGSTTS